MTCRPHLLSPTSAQIVDNVVGHSGGRDRVGTKVSKPQYKIQRERHQVSVLGERQYVMVQAKTRSGSLITTAVADVLLENDADLGRRKTAEPTARNAASSQLSPVRGRARPSPHESPRAKVIAARRGLGG